MPCGDLHTGPSTSGGYKTLKAASPGLLPVQFQACSPTPSHPLYLLDLYRNAFFLIKLGRRSIFLLFPWLGGAALCLIFQFSRNFPGLRYLGENKKPVGEVLLSWVPKEQRQRHDRALGGAPRGLRPQDSCPHSSTLSKTCFPRGTSEGPPPSATQVGVALGAGT